MITRIWSTTSMSEAELLCDLLRHFEIRAFVDNRFSFYAIEMPTCATPFFVAVHDDAVGDAVQVVERFATILSGRVTKIPGERAGDGVGDCGDLFGFTMEEEQRLIESVIREKRRHRTAWWLILLCFYPMTLPMILLLTFLIHDPASEIGIEKSA